MRDDTKNGCVADYCEPRVGSKFSAGRKFVHPVPCESSLGVKKLKDQKNLFNEKDVFQSVTEALLGRKNPSTPKRQMSSL